MTCFDTPCFLILSNESQVAAILVDAIDSVAVILVDEVDFVLM